MGIGCDEVELTHLIYLPSGEGVIVRTAEPQDAPSIQAYIHGLSPASRQSRFLGSLNVLSPAELARMTRADHGSGRTLIAELATDGPRIMIGEARYAVAPDGLGCELAVSVAEAWRRRTLGSQLLAGLVRRAKSLRIRYLFGDVLRTNEPMRALVRKLGFSETAPIGDARLVRITKDLTLAHTSVAEVGLRGLAPATQTCSIAV
jgi:GNAT superfamily N-acetyltransferase